MGNENGSIAINWMSKLFWSFWFSYFCFILFLLCPVHLWPGIISTLKSSAENEEVVFLFSFILSVLFSLLSGRSDST